MIGSELSSPGATVTRRRRVVAGEGMVTPRQRLTIADDGTVETLVPGRDRLSVDHPFVARYPERFELCWSKDTETRAQLRVLVERAHRPTSPSRLGDDNNYGLGPGRPRRPDWSL